jgi:hypothetical protein
MKRSRSAATQSEKGQDDKQHPTSPRATANTLLSKHQHKKSRTERYLLEVQRLEKQRGTLKYFRNALMAVGGTCNSAFPSASTLQHSLAKNWERRQECFQSFRQEMLDSAQSVVDLKNGLDSMQQCAMEHTSTKTNPLESLNQGHETTIAIFDRIATFAGKPNDTEVVDCEQLIALACSIDGIICMCKTLESY